MYSLLEMPQHPLLHHKLIGMVLASVSLLCLNPMIHENYLVRINQFEGTLRIYRLLSFINETVKIPFKNLADDSDNPEWEEYLYEATV